MVFSVLPKYVVAIMHWTVARLLPCMVFLVCLYAVDTVFYMVSRLLLCDCQSVLSGVFFFFAFRYSI